MFNLIKLAYMACNDDEKEWYDTISKSIVKVDVQRCCLELKKTIIQNSIDPSSTELCTLAACNGHLNCLAFALKIGYVWNMSTCAFFIRLIHSGYDLRGHPLQRSRLFNI